MKTRGIIALLLVIIMLLALPTVTWAAYQFYAILTVTETSGNSYTQLPAIATVDNTYLQTKKFINTTGNNTDVQIGGSHIPYMITDNATLFSTPLSAYSQVTPNYYLGYTPEQSDFDVITGYGGNITVADNDTIELGGIFNIKWRGYIITDSGVDKDILFKANAYRLRVDSTVSGNITFSITGGSLVSALSIASGLRTIEIVSDNTTLKIYVDTILKGSANMTGEVPDSGDNLIITRNNVSPYWEYLTIEN